MRLTIAATLLLTLCGLTTAQEKGIAVEWGALKSTTPAGWKEEKPSSSMRLAQFKLAKADGDATDAELALFLLPGGGGVEANLDRQVKKFEMPAGKKPEDCVKTEKIKVGTNDAVYQDVTGTFISKNPPFDPNAKITKMENYRQLYVIFEVKDGGKAGTYSATLLGPTKTIEKHKKDFEDWVKNFK
jgi:hypothetical protein